jgi:hypothetical protein
MLSHTSTFGWIRSRRRFVAIVVAVALAFTIIGTLAASGFGTDAEVAADGDGSMVVAGLSWSRMSVWTDPGDDPPPNGLSWSAY